MLFEHSSAESDKRAMITADKALPGRSDVMSVPETHFVNHNPLQPPFPSGVDIALFALGCFWGAERRFWQQDGVYSTAVGYAGGYTPNPTYEEVCTGKTGHAEVVLVAFRPDIITYRDLLKVFWEAHDPTQGMQQGGDKGTQYRSGIYCYSEEQLQVGQESLEQYQRALTEAGFPTISTTVSSAPELYYAEAYHQQYLAKNPGGYCGLSGTGVVCEI